MCVCMCVCVCVCVCVFPTCLLYVLVGYMCLFPPPCNCRCVVKVKVYSGQEVFEKKFPLLAAVNRCAQRMSPSDASVSGVCIKSHMYFVL